jgi:SAM-dependent methyltransferase
MKFTGERFVPGLTGEIKYAHLHRYALTIPLITNKDVLDVASGEGYGSALLARVAKSVIGVDIDPESVKHAEQNYGDVANLQFRVGSCAALAVETASVDAVVSFETIEHHDRHTEMMLEIKRVLRRDGILIISSPNRPVYSEQFDLVNPFHVKELDYQELAQLLQGHFRFVQIFGQKMAAGSFVFPLEEGPATAYLTYEGNGTGVRAKVPPLREPQFFIAVCSDREIFDMAGPTSLYLDRNDELIESMHRELSQLRAMSVRDAAILEEFRSSMSLRLVRNVVWPVSSRIVPRLVRTRLRKGAQKLKRRIADRQVAPNEDLSAYGADLPPIEVLPLVDFIPQKIAPLKLEVSDRLPRRINVLIPTVNFQYFFAGGMCMLNFALRLKRAGYAVRLIVVDPCDYDLARWKREAAEYDGLATFFDEVEVSYVADRAHSVPVSRDDVFAATCWWTAHIAHRAVQETRRDRFIYLIQEYEPMFYPAGSFSALAEEAYQLPHHAIFSTEVLRDYFVQQRAGIFATANGDQPPKSLIIRNAVNAYAVSEDELRSRQGRKLLFYARPEQQNNARNMFELGAFALRETIREGWFDSGEWQFHGIGGMYKYNDIPLHRQTHLKMMPGRSLPKFRQLLPHYDLGLSLMLTPHTSLMPLDMAAAGLVAVTNTYATKTHERMSAISNNIIAVPPTLNGLKAGLVAALTRVDDFAARVEASRLNWCRNWDETFNPAIVRQLCEWID